MGWTYYQASNFKNGRVDRKAEVLDVFNNHINSKLLKMTSKGNDYYGLFEDNNKKMWVLLLLTSVSKTEFGYKDICLNPTEIGGIPNSVLKDFVPSTEEDAKWLKDNLEANERQKKRQKQITS